METEFSMLPWHDAELLGIEIDRHNPGECDQISMSIRWPSDVYSELIFSGCYELEIKMNFGVIASESILDASLIQDSYELDSIRKRWRLVGVNLSELKCFEIRTNTTNSLIRIYALSYSIR